MRNRPRAEVLETLLSRVRYEVLPTSNMVDDVGRAPARSGS